MTWVSGFDSEPLATATTTREPARGVNGRCEECLCRPCDGEQIELIRGETASGILISKFRCIPCADAFRAACELDDDVMVAPPAIGALWLDLNTYVRKRPADGTAVDLLADLSVRLAQGEAEVRFEEQAKRGRMA